MLATLVSAFFLLAIANICSALMVQAENRNRPHLAGLFEAGWAVLYLVAAKCSIDNIGGDIKKTTITLLVLIVGNYLGGYLGTRWGEHLVKDKDDEVVDERISEAEAALDHAHRAIAELEAEVQMHHDLEELRDTKRKPRNPFRR